MSSSPPPTRVSVVIPAYDEGTTLPHLVSALVERLAVLEHVAVEMVVVDDGSRAEDSALTQEAVQRAAQVWREGGARHSFHCIRAPRNGGKGSAIRLGWTHVDAEAEWLGWLDADGSVSAAEFVRMLGLLREEPAVHVFAGSRIKMAGRHIERRVFRHLQGRVFATITERWLRLGLYDTQCGIKLMRADWVRPLIPLLEEDGWMLDVELLALLKARGARIAEVPIDWADMGTSKVRLGIDAMHMLWALKRIRARAAVPASIASREVRTV